MDKDFLLSHVNDKEAREVLTHLLDLVDISLEQHREQVSDFLDPYHASLAEGVLRGIGGITYLFSGGYPGAERKRLVVAPDYLTQEQLDPEIVYLWITGNFTFRSLSHRDYLGAIMSLGIKREKVGDLLVLNEGCQAIMDRNIARYAQLHLTKINQVSVTVEVRELDSLCIPPVRTKVVQATVASLRLDSVAAAGFGVSRNKMSNEIKAQRLRVNWKPETNAAAAVTEGDIISCRGRGRVIVKKIGGKSKKGRYHVLLERLI